MKIKRSIQLLKLTVYDLRLLLRRYKQNRFHPYFLDELIYGQDHWHNPNKLHFYELGKENRGMIVAVIKFPKEWIKTAGFFALLNRTLCGIHFADRLGLKPVVDNWDGCAYEEEDLINNTKIVFEYYFKPLCEISMNSALNSHRVVAVSNPNMDIVLTENNSTWYNLTDEYIEDIAKVYGKYVKLNDIVQTQMNHDIDGLLMGKTTLAIHFRGSDYKLNVNGHPIALTIEDYFSYIDEALLKYNFEQIFLATDDKNAVSSLKNRYDNVICYSDTFRTEGDVSVAFIENDRKHHKYRLGYEVLRDAYTLAACDGLIAGFSQVSIGARINKLSQNKEYQYIKIIDKGVNHNTIDWIQYYNKNIAKKKENR